jgi:hypothetical protein
MTLRARWTASREGTARGGATTGEGIDLREPAGPDDLIEIQVVVREHHLETLAQLAGTPSTAGRSSLVEVTFRRDARFGPGRATVAVLGRVVAEVERHQAELLSAALRRHDGPALAGSGLIISCDDGSGPRHALRVWASARALQQVLHPV